MVRSKGSCSSCSNKGSKIRKNATPSKKKTKEESKSFFEIFRNGVTDISRSMGRLTNMRGRNASAVNVSKNKLHISPARSNSTPYKANKSRTPPKTTKANTPRRSTRIRNSKKTSRIAKKSRTPVTKRSSTRKSHNLKQSTSTTSTNMIESIPSFEVSTVDYISDVPRSYKSISRNSSVHSNKSSRKSSKSKKSKSKSRKNKSRNSSGKSKDDFNKQETESEINQTISPVGIMRRMVNASVNSIKGNLIPRSISQVRETSEVVERHVSQHKSIPKRTSHNKKRKHASANRRGRSAKTKRNVYSLQASDSELEVREKRVDMLIKEFDGATTDFLYNGLLAPEVPKPAFLFYVNDQREKKRAKLAGEAMASMPRTSRAQEQENREDAIIIANNWSQMGKAQRTPYLDLERDDRCRHQLQTLTYQTELNKVRQIDGRRRS